MALNIEWVLARRVNDVEEIIRKGIIVEVKAPDGFKDTIKSIPGNRLEPSQEAVRYDIAIERDLSSSLRLTLQSLGSHVNNLRDAWA